MAKSFRLEGDMSARLNQFGPRVNRAMVAAANYTAPQIQAFMMSEASWTDRTSNARNGLRCKVVVQPDKVALVLHHSVPYGVFLELRWGGKYGIIPAAMAAGGPLFLEMIKRLAFDE